MFEFIGKVHPLLVHLPIGFLLIAVIFIWINEPGRPVKISIGLGTLAAIASVATGLLLANNEGYGDDVQLHKWSGIVLMIVSIAMWFIPTQYLKAGSIIMTVLIFLTGHFGGTLTHGSLIGESEPDNLDINTLDRNNAKFYDDAVKPILEARCYSCHGEQKQKGGLRLNNQQAIDKGGKNGKIVVAGNPGESEIVRRLELPLDDEDHMPPKEKKQLTNQEKKLISLWIASGADFRKKIGESLSEDQVAELYDKTDAIELPESDVSPPDKDVVARLVEQNVAITPIANSSNFLQVSFISVPNDAEKLLKELKPIAKNVISLKLNDAKIQDIDLSEFVNLRELNLSGTQLSSVQGIVKCETLRSLNLSGTHVTNVQPLEGLKNLRYLNLYKTDINEATLPNVHIEFGNYSVPTLQTDTTQIKN